MSHHDRQAVGMEIVGPAKDPNSWKDNRRCPITIARLSDVNFDPPERGIAIQQCEIKKYIENEDSDYPQNRRITIASYGFGRNTVLR
ncbi:hypothetical protein AAC387_Pa07g1987 [Persea americana]